MPSERITDGSSSLPLVSDSCGQSQLPVAIEHILAEPFEKPDYSASALEKARRMLEEIDFSKFQSVGQVALESPVEQSLTSAELVTLELSRRGYTASEIAQLRYSSIHTVRNHLRTIHEKLQVPTAYLAIVKAEKLGIVPFPPEEE